MLMQPRHLGSPSPLQTVGFDRRTLLAAGAASLTLAGRAWRLMTPIGHLAAVVVCATLVMPPGSATAQTASAIQVPIPKSAAEVPGPVPGNTMTNAYVQLVGRMAYVWGYPMVNAHNRRAAFAEAPEPGLLGGVVPIAPIGYNQMLTNYISPDETFIVCPNQDFVYGGGFTALDKEPTVIQVPYFGDRFYVYAMYDERTAAVMPLGSSPFQRGPTIM